MSMRRPVVGGNWKMNTDLATAVRLAGDVAAGCADLLAECDIVLYPPFPYLHAVTGVLSDSPGVTLGAQDLYFEANGAFTGEVSADMLLDVGATAVLVGHSERRHVIGETDEIVAGKVRAALGRGLSVTLCVGETLEQREAGQTDAVNDRQLRAALEGVDREQMAAVVIAYEPVWAIGTGRSATPEDAQAAHLEIRRTLESLYDGQVAQATRLQYGGSVKPSNAGDLASRDDVDGFLVGGASLRAEDFLAIIRAAATCCRC